MIPDYDKNGRGDELGVSRKDDGSSDKMAKGVFHGGGSP